MLTIIGWVWVGILIGFVMGVILISMMASGKQADLEAENLHLIFVRDSLKEEIFRLENQPKPKPRKKRNLRVNSIKVGKQIYLLSYLQVNSLNGDLMKYLKEFGIIHLKIDELESKVKNNYGNGSSKMNGFLKQYSGEYILNGQDKKDLNVIIERMEQADKDRERMHTDIKFIKENMFDPHKGLWAETKQNSQFRENATKWRSVIGTGVVGLLFKQIYDIFSSQIF